MQTEAGALLDLASVELLSAARDTADGPAAQTATDAEGAFTLQADPGAYVLQISFLALKSYRRRLDLPPGRTDLGTIVLVADTLAVSGITATTQRSQISLSLEKRVFRVGKDISVTGGSALDVLNNVPSLTTDFRGTISLRGSSAVRILIDGKPSLVYTNGSRALQNLPADMIEEVQVITNPSAKYRAEGSAGIINIILKKNKDAGFHGTMGLTQRRPEASELSTNLNYARGRVNWFFDGAVGFAADPSRERTYQRYQASDTAYLYHAFNNGDETDWDGELKAGADVHLTIEQTLTVGGLFQFEDKQDRWRGAWVDSTLTGAFMDRIERTDTIGGGERGAGLTLDYENLLDGDRHKLSVVAAYEHLSHRELPRIVEADAGAPFDTLFSAVGDVRLSDALRVRADWVRPFADSGKVQAGVDGDFSWGESRYDTRERRSAADEWTALPAYNSNFRLSDHVGGAYGTVSSRFGSLDYEIGLRAEAYRIRTTLRATGAGTRQAGADLFPSVFFTYHLTPRRSIQASYSRRISRPRPSLLLARTSYADSRSIFTGNPDLRPEFGDSYEVQLLESWETGSLLASVYDRHRTGVVQEIRALDANGVLRTTPFNLATADDHGVELVLQEGFADDLKLSATANFFRTRARGSHQGTRYATDTNRFTSRAQLQWTLPEGTRLQMSLRYDGPAKTVQGRRASRSWVNAALARDFLDGRATLSINSQDLFNMRRERFTIVGPTYSTDQEYWEPSGLRVNFTYRIHQPREADDDGP